MNFNQPQHNHPLDKPEEKVNCPICKESTFQNNEDSEFQSTERGKILRSPHKLINGVITACENQDCEVCNKSHHLNADIVYHMDLPGPCLRCGDNSCCEGIERTRIFNLK